MSNLADLLRQHVRSSGMAVSALALAAGVSPPLLWAFMARPQKTLNLQTADKLIDYFGLEIRPRRRGGA